MTTATKNKLIIVGILGALAVSLGAFAAHGLKPHLSPYQQDIFKTGNQYHFIHLLAMFMLVFWLDKYDHPMLRRAFWAMFLGIVLFSGSLYLLAIHDIFALPKAILGPITPLGGLCFIIGWVLLIIYAVKYKSA